MIYKYIRSTMVVSFSVLVSSITIYAQGVKYPILSSSQVVLVGDSGIWDSSKVHTLSVVEANKGGYRYWGYYGLAYYGGDPNLRKAGLVRSNDLVHWDKYVGNPIITYDCRWQTVVMVGSTFYMFYSEYDSLNDSRIVMVTSKDGIHFNHKLVMVPRQRGKQNQNPFIYFNKQDRYYYLFYYSGIEKSKDSTKNIWQIKLRKSENITNLRDAKATTLLSSRKLIAAPSLAYFNNRYFLLVESRVVGKWDDKWVTLAYGSKRTAGKYKMTNGGAPVLANDDACAFQYIFDDQLYIFYSHSLDLTKWNWELKMVKATR